MSIGQFQYIDTQSSWLSCLEDLQKQDQIAIDLESNSLYVYKEHVCLIQISTPNRDYIIDPLALDHFTELGNILKNQSIEKIFHACEYDLILLKREYNWDVVNIFDTMWAARILGMPKIGLANLIKTFFDITLEKKYQTANWGERPLSDEQLLYAQSDTHYLFDLRSILQEKLDLGDHREEAQEIFEMQQQVTVPNNQFREEQFWDLNGTKYLTTGQKKTAYALYLFREANAKKYDKPLFKIFDNKVLLQLAQDQPYSMKRLYDTRRLPNWFIRREGDAMLHAVKTAQELSLPKRPKRPPRPAQDLLDRYDYLLQWRKNRGKARGVDSDIILSKDAVWEIAKINPNEVSALNPIQSTIGPWRLQTYGEEIINHLDDYRKNQR